MCEGLLDTIVPEILERGHKWIVKDFQWKEIKIISIYHFVKSWMVKQLNTNKTFVTESLINYMWYFNFFWKSEVGGLKEQ